MRGQIWPVGAPQMRQVGVFSDGVELFELEHGPLSVTGTFDILVKFCVLHEITLPLPIMMVSVN